VIRSIKALTGLLGLTALAVAAPIELSHDPLALAPNAAAAKPGGNGKGRGHGRGHGPDTGELETQNDATGKSNAGHANGRAVGHAPSDAVSGVEQAAAPGQAKNFSSEEYSGNLGVKGSFNAIHSAAINKGVVSANSRVAKVEAYVNAAQDLTNAEDGEGDVEAAIEAAAVAAANASNKTVTAEMLDQVNAYSNERGLTTPGIDVEPEHEDEVAERAQAIQGEP